MTENNIISDNKSLVASLRKVGSDFIGGLSTISVSELSSSKILKSIEESNSKESKFDIPFYLKEDTYSSNLKSVTLPRPPTKTLHKEEIARYILDEIILNVEKSISINSIREGKYPKIFEKKVKEETVIEKYSPNRHNQNENIKDKSTKRLIKTVVRELELPITLPKTKTNVDSSPKFERQLFSSLASTSSTITSKSFENPIKTTDDSVSFTSKHSEVKIEINEDIKKDKSAITSPFVLCWCFGFNPEVPILNLSNHESSHIVFANSQYAVLYDFHEDTMSFMQGHLNTVSCMASTLTGSVIATADSTSEVETSRVIVWDRRPCILQVLDNVHPYGCQQIGLSSNGEFLVTVSASQMPICIKVWDWKKDSKQAAASVIVKESLGNVKKLTMHDNSKREFAVTFERSVVFVHLVWQIILEVGEAEEITTENEIINVREYDVSIYIPSKLGSLTDTTFFECGEAIALSSTCKGYVIVWENTFSKSKRNYRKYVRLHLDCITNIQTVDNQIAVATASGNVSFYDFGLTILYFHKLREPIVSLSFNLNTQNHVVNTCEEHDSCANLWRKEPRKLVDATLKHKPFSARHFIVSTESGRIAYFNVSCGNPKYLMPPSKAPFTALDMLPNGKFLCAGTASGQCILFDSEQRKVKVSHQIKVPTHLCQAISFLKYSPSGHILACAMYTGNIWILDPLLLTPTFESPLNDSKCCITQMEFTTDSEYLIVVDVSFCISVYFLEVEPTLIGQYIAHYKPIVKIVLVDDKCKESKNINILTISEDRSISSFKIDTENKGFIFISNQRIEQTAIPMYSVYYPYPYTSASLYLEVNNEHKFRLCDLSLSLKDNTTTGRVRGMFQAPEFGSPIDYMDIFENSGNSYLFLKTNNHIAIHLLPVDGNPYRALGFRASPTDITCCRIHPNGEYVFTISEFCSGISMWKINIEAVEDFYKSGGEGLEPFLRTLGQEKVNDIIDFFELGQFLHQGESPFLARTLRNSLPICEVANVLQALGCLLTRQEIQEIITELIGKDLENPTYNVEYDDFVRLYFNHRSTVGLKIKDLKQAFRNFHNGVYYNTFSLGQSPDSNLSEPIFDTLSFIQNLNETGEEYSLDELLMDFSILTGGQYNPSRDDFPLNLPPNIPNEISFETFVKDILGFSVDEN